MLVRLVGRYSRMAGHGQSAPTPDTADHSRSHFFVSTALDVHSLLAFPSHLYLPIYIFRLNTFAYSY